MVTFEEQLARLARTEEFLDRQIELSDDNKSDVLEALINNTWGTLNVTSDNNTINLDIYLRELGIDPDNIPEFVSSEIFQPTTFDLTRELSSLVPSGVGIDLGITFEIEERQFLQDVILRPEDRFFTTQTIALQKLIDDLKGGLLDTVGSGTLVTRVRDLDPQMVYEAEDPAGTCSSHNCETTLDTQIGSDTGTVAIIGLIALMVLS